MDSTPRLISEFPAPTGIANKLFSKFYIGDYVVKKTRNFLGLSIVTHIRFRIISQISNEKVILVIMSNFYIDFSYFKI